ncbi:MAG: elongation factor G [Pseudomonadota bacterium]|uniref:elongation factor G n=1 Tax=Phenylobacterium sp. TaxID=1871053 RepID=UPI0025F7C598|nr:elongation factor G [Phenylobacterium sp.]MBT9473766.1 elongation factor G [Phenylobacterium sp.]
MGRPGSGSTRAIALVGAPGAGKTTLLEAMLFASGAILRQGEVGATSVGDASPEARQRGQSTELNIAGFEFMGERYAVIDCPGSPEFSGCEDYVLPAVDLAVVVADPNPVRAGLLQPILKALEDRGVPHAVFVNRIDQARGGLDDFMAALAPASGLPLVARQIPLVEQEKVTGFVDLALERAFVYRPGQASAQIDLSGEIAALEADARFHMLEQLADFDDELMEQLLSDLNPSQDAVFADLVADLSGGLIVPVFFGSALNGFGVRRLLKALRHETPDVSVAAERMGLDGACAYVFKTSYAGQAGKVAYARVMGGALTDGEELTAETGDKCRAGGLLAVSGLSTRKIDKAQPGDVVGIAKLEAASAGQVLSMDGKARASVMPVSPLPTLYAMSIAAKDRKDDVRLSAALAKLAEEDPALEVTLDPETQETLISGRGETHLQVTVERLRRRFGLEATTQPPKVSYKESVRKPVTQRGRHKKQTGGHGQFGDVVLEIKPRARGEGFAFSQKITGGVVPKQWIPSVEQGVRDALERGPLGFPVTDVEVVLTDGSYHSVDSSEMSFRAAGRLAMSDGLRASAPYLLEPIEKLTIHAPQTSTSKITQAVSARRGQILGFQPREGWSGWDDIEVCLPRAERQHLIAELRGLTQGLGDFTAQFDHMAEIPGRLAEEIVKRERPAA